MNPYSEEILYNLARELNLDFWEYTEMVSDVLLCRHIKEWTEKIAKSNRKDLVESFKSVAGEG